MSDEYDILLPNRDPGIQLIPGMKNFPKTLKVPKPKFSHIIATSTPAQTIALHRAMIEGKKLDLADFCIQFPSFPIIVDDFTYRGRYPRVGGKIILSGASGRRIRKRLLDFDKDGALDAKVVSQLTEAITDPDFCIPMAAGEVGSFSELPFLIEAKNLSNFYHFTTETLVYLALYKEYALKGEIQIFTKNPAPPESFVERSIRSFYPELLSRITVNQAKVESGKAIIPFNMQHYFSFRRDLGHEVIRTPHTDVPCVEPVYRNMKAISRGSRDGALDMHRSRAISAASHDSKRKYVYIRRKSGNVRGIGGEESLLEMLLGHGFVVVSFEDFTPLEQAHLINDVDILVSSHGAGFANMLYGKPNALFIELSHLQNARHRFGDFHMHAGASGARHLHLFADHDYTDDDVIPDIKSTGLLGVKLPDIAIKRLDGFLKSIIYRREFINFKQRIERLSEAGDFAEVRATVNRDKRFLYSLADIPIAAATAHEFIHEYHEAAAFYQIALEVSPFRAQVRQRLVQALVRARDVSGLIGALSAFRTLAPYWYNRYFGDSEQVEVLIESAMGQIDFDQAAPPARMPR